MKRPLAAGLAAVAGVGALAYALSTPRVHDRSFANDSGRRVELFKQKDHLVGEGVAISIDSFVGDHLIESEVIDDRDLWQDFDDRFPDAEWLGPDVLRLGQAADFARAQTGTLVVRNALDKPASLASLRAGNSRFLVFDLAPGETVALPFVLNTSQEWIAAEFWSGSDLFDNAASFVTRCGDSKRSEFRVTVMADRVLLESSDFQRVGHGP